MRMNSHHIRRGVINNAHSKTESGNQNGDAAAWLNDMPNW